MPTSNIENALTELNRQLAEHPIAKLAFMQMPPERQHELIKHIAETKKVADRKQRVEKSIGLLETWWATNKAQIKGDS